MASGNTPDSTFPTFNLWLSCLTISIFNPTNTHITHTGLEIASQSHRTNVPLSRRMSRCEDRAVPRGAPDRRQHRQAAGPAGGGVSDLSRRDLDRWGANRSHPNATVGAPQNVARACNN